MRIRVGHLYPDYLNIYADRGNIAVLARRAAWRGHELEVVGASVGVDVQVVRIEMPDDDLHAARSQYCGTWPRLETIRRSASIAV